MDDDFFGKRFGDSSSRRGFDELDSFFFSDFNRVFQEMDQMVKKHFGLGSFSIFEEPNQSKPPAAIEPPPKNPKSLRERFFKDKTNEQEKQSSSFIFPNSPFQENHGNNRQSIFDEDLDTKIEREGFDKVLREDLFRNTPYYPQHNQPPPVPYHQPPPPPHHHHFNPFHHNHHYHPQQPQPHPHQQQQQHHSFNIPFHSPHLFGAGQAYSVRRIQRPDGSIEEVKTVRNSDGKEEKTVTRIIGDKAHSVIEKKANNQIQETEEIFHNFDEDKIDEFNRMWNSFSSSNEARKANERLQQQLQQPQQPKAIKSGKEQEVTVDNANSTANMSIVKSEKTPSIFSKLFSWLKK